MPEESKKQGKFMRAVEHNPQFAKKVGVTAATAKKVLGEGENKSSAARYRSAGKEPGKYKKF